MNLGKGMVFFLCSFLDDRTKSLQKKFGNPPPAPANSPQPPADSLSPSVKVKGKSKGKGKGRK